MIDYNVLAAAVTHYSALGYKYVEVPWLVSEEINAMTCPDWVQQYIVKKGDRTKAFIGSGEQGFLYLISKGHLAPGYYQTVTPCMRNDHFDQTHSKYFMKNELISFGGSRSLVDARDTLTAAALSFFSTMSMVEPKKFDVIETPEGQDIEFQAIELGSYGIRKSLMVDWVYGTGVAEPRFSTVFRK